MFRFTIRDVLWLMLVVGMGCVWWLNNRSQKAEQDKLRVKLAEKEERIKQNLINAARDFNDVAWGKRDLELSNTNLKKKLREIEQHSARVEMENYDLKGEIKQLRSGTQPAHDHN